jgi:uncharacterized membrane protein
MKKVSFIDAFVWLIWALPLVYLIYTYPSLPNTVAVHFNLEGEADRMGNKNEMVIGVCIMAVVAVGIYFLMKYLPNIDPKRSEKADSKSFKKIAHAVILLLSGIGISIVYSAVIGKITIGNLLFPALGIFFTYMGNIMYNLKPNYFAGIRTPWTLHNEANWKTTHRLAGKFWFIGGIVITIGTLVMPTSWAFIFFISIVLGITIIPIIYSYTYFKKHNNK